MSESADLLHAPGPWSHRFLDANGARLHAVTAGFDPTSTPQRVVILLHSFPQHWYAWREVLAAAGDLDCAMVAVDLRGYGASDKPPSRFSIPTLAADVVGVVSALGAREAIVVGHGLGGVVARAAAAYYPDVIRHVVAVSSPHPARWRLARSRHLARIAPAILTPVLAERGLTSGTTVSLVINELTDESSPTRAASYSYTDALRSPFAARCALEQLRWLIRSRRRPSGRQFLAELERAYWIVPVTEICGRRDALWDPSSCSDDARRSPGGHFLPEEDPDTILTALRAALSDFS